MREYAIYKGDKFIMIGTAEEIAKKMNIKKSTVYFWCSPAYKKRGTYNKKIVIPLDDEE